MSKRKRAPMPSLPVSENLRKRLPKMSRAARYKAVRIENGLCSICGDEPLVTAALGQNCLQKHNDYMRAKRGSKLRHVDAYQVEQATPDTRAENGSARSSSRARLWLAVIQHEKSRAAELRRQVHVLLSEF